MKRRRSFRRARRGRLALAVVAFVSAALIAGWFLFAPAPEGANLGHGASVLAGGFVAVTLFVVVAVPALLLLASGACLLMRDGSVALGGILMGAVAYVQLALVSAVCWAWHPLGKIGPRGLVGGVAIASVALCAIFVAAAVSERSS